MVRITDDELDTIVGALYAPDRDLFRVLLSSTARTGGDLAELGVLEGQSAVLIGESQQVGETFTVIDLFDDVGVDANDPENYPGLTRSAFEANYLRYFATLPVVVQDFSDRIVDVAKHGSHRFVHIDASHQHHHVVGDIEAARILLQPDGIVVLDDIRQPHTPGVAAAAWGAVARDGLIPFAISPHKLYATWGRTDDHRSTVLAWLEGNADWTHETQSIDGRPLIRIFPVSHAQRPRHPAKRFVPAALWPAAARVRRALG